MNRIVASVTDNTVILSNGGEVDLYYFLVERGTTATIFWVPTVSDDGAVLKPGSSVNIPFGNITGYKAGDKEVILYYWDAVTANGEKVPGEVQNELLILP